jgi:esterase/lipase
MKPILLLHGALGATSQLEPLKTLLSKQGRTVFTLNFSGHSGEPFSPAGFGIEIFAQNVFDFLNTQAIQKTDVFGYSMGGYVALWCAHQQPHYFNKIITLGTKFDWSVASAEKEIKKLDPKKIEEKVPAFARILQHRHTPNDWKVLIQKTADMMTQLGRQPLLTESVLAAIRIPTRVVLGDKDDMADRVYSEQVASVLPNGKFYLLENTPHPIEKVELPLLTSVLNIE